MGTKKRKLGSSQPPLTKVKSAEFIVDSDSDAVISHVSSTGAEANYKNEGNTSHKTSGIGRETGSRKLSLQELQMIQAPRKTGSRVLEANRTRHLSENASPAHGQQGKHTPPSPFRLVGSKETTSQERAWSAVDRISLDGLRQVAMSETQLTSQLSFLLSDSAPDGLQMWHITAPASVPASSIFQDVAQISDPPENVSIVYHNTTYHFETASAEQGTQQILLPCSEGNAYHISAQSIQRNLHLRQKLEPTNGFSGRVGD